MLSMIYSAVALVAITNALVASGSTIPQLTVQTPSDVPGFEDVKVPVVLGVMSACPDAILCESVFDNVLKKVGGKVDLSLTFIGRYVLHQLIHHSTSPQSCRPNTSEPDFGVTCMHGANECAGNVQELCAMKYTPTSTWWRFVQCQNFQGRYEVGKPDTAAKCANAAEIDWEGSGVGQCAGLDYSGKGEEGVQLLQESVAITKSMGIECVDRNGAPNAAYNLVTEKVALSLSTASRSAFTTKLGRNAMYV